ncbi:ABC transporter ATP-binding protein [Calycomorphotria hydatis]|uniref:Heterocyst differentiation ATP-binding protein HepA n=1 Tax=Calycomorphotria hydatis TaxID=2528027 RepID=A0A517TD42_9PLAN|nr:ABC transporter ATP-binding protein [Calycomorphotria hydatis]QDT66292.1 Heterocyst differentiation ATP-binding protein HepA [Calycomorphotria hydatis]
METTGSQSFNRLFPWQQLFKGDALSAMLCSLVGSVCLCLLLLVLFFIADLLESRGHLQINPGEQEELAAIMGLPVPDEIIQKPVVEPEPVSVDEETDTEEELVEPDDDSDLTEDVSEEIEVEEVANVIPPVLNLPPLVQDDTGILHLAWWSRDSAVGAIAGAMYRNIPLTRTNRSALFFLLMCAVVFGLVRTSLLAMARRYSDAAALETVTRLRLNIHEHALRMGPSDLEGRESESVLKLFTHDATAVRDGVASYVYRLGRHPYKLALLVLVAFSVHWIVSLQCLLPLAVCWYLVHRERRRVHDAKARSDDHSIREINLVGESLQRSRLIRGFAMEDFEQQRFEASLDRYQRNATSARRQERFSQAIFRTLLVICFSLIALLLGAKVLATGGDDLTLAAALCLLAIFYCMYHPAEMLMELRRDRATAGIAADRIFRFLSRTPPVSQAVGAKFLQPLSERIHLENVTYSLPNTGVLIDGLTLTIPANKHIAFVASDPLAGRALVDLLPRFIEPTKGKITYDGEDIAWVTLESLRAETVPVSYRDTCFTGTVRENITCGRTEFSLHQVTDAAKAAHAHGFIQRLPQGYETVVGDGGESLDVGQEFCIALARAILRDPAVVIIEEPRIPLDDDTKAILDDTYKRFLPGRTVIMLPFRLSSLKKADQVVMLHHGQIAAAGKHAELVRKSSFYRHWEYTNYNEFRQDSEPVGELMSETN